MIVLHMSPDEEKWFKEMLDIFLNPALTLAERWALLNSYQGRSAATDDSIQVLQKVLHEDMVYELGDGIIDAEVIDVELLE